MSAAQRFLDHRSLRLCWAGEDPFERGSVIREHELIGEVVNRDGMFLRLDAQAIHDLVRWLGTGRPAPCPLAWAANYNVSVLADEDETGHRIYLGVARRVTGALTHFGRYGTRLWLEPLDGPAVDFEAPYRWLPGEREMAAADAQRDVSGVERMLRQVGRQ